MWWYYKHVSSHLYINVRINVVQYNLSCLLAFIHIFSQGLTMYLSLAWNWLGSHIGWPWTHSSPHASASHVLELWSCAPLFHPFLSLIDLELREGILPSSARFLSLSSFLPDLKIHPPHREANICLGRWTDGCLKDWFGWQKQLPFETSSEFPSSLSHILSACLHKRRLIPC